MASVNDRILKRECSATRIPSGEVLTLPPGLRVTVTHRFGGNFTVVADQGMFRILGQDADALDEAIPEEAILPEAASDTEAHEGPPDEAQLWEKLKGVYDPEIPVNIVNLGLVYSLQVLPLDETHYGVLMHMTLTAPGCGMGPSIAADAKARLLTVPGVQEATVEIVWDPPWAPEMISEEGKMQLGLI